MPLDVLVVDDGGALHAESEALTIGISSTRITTTCVDVCMCMRP
jgi:hypothetical protein